MKNNVKNQDVRTLTSHIAHRMLTNCIFLKEKKTTNGKWKSKTEFIYYVHVMQHGYNALIKLVQSIFHPVFAPLYVHGNFNFNSTMQWSVSFYVPSSSSSSFVLCILRAFGLQTGHTNIHFHFQCADSILGCYILNIDIYEKGFETSSWHYNIELCNMQPNHIFKSLTDLTEQILK